MSKITYEPATYLPTFRERENLIADLIDFHNKDVVDLNCLYAPLAPLIPECNHYICNDVINTNPHTNLKYVEFYNLPDEDFVPLIKKCDVLVILGHSWYQKDPNEQESKTLIESRDKIIKTHKPELVVLEGITEFEGAFDQLSGYIPIYRKEIHIPSIHPRVGSRVLYVHKRNS